MFRELDAHAVAGHTADHLAFDIEDSGAEGESQMNRCTLRKRGWGAHIAAAQADVLHSSAQQLGRIAVEHTYTAGKIKTGALAPVGDAFLLPLRRRACATALGHIHGEYRIEPADVKFLPKITLAGKFLGNCSGCNDG